MALALAEAQKAYDLGEVPIGAVVVSGIEVISSSYNRREFLNDPSSHAEFTAITEAAHKLNRWRLSDCTVYVTLEPCLMCAGLMHQARIRRCVYGAADPKAGALGSLYEVQNDVRLNHTFAVTTAVLEDKSTSLLRNFFESLRNQERQDGSVIERVEHVPVTETEHAIVTENEPETESETGIET